MLGRILFSAVIISVLLIGTARAQQRAPTPQEINDIEALVTKAAALVESKGKEAAFAEFGKRNSEWWHGDTYLFAYDMNGSVLLNPAVPSRVGTNPTAEKDANGKAFHHALGGPAQQPIFFKGAIKTIRRGFAVSNSVSRGWTNEPKNFYWSS
jgi:cytochrome c